MSMLTFRNAFRSAIVLASGLQDSAVFWGQSAGRMADPAIVLSIVSNVAITPMREAMSARIDDDYDVELSQLRDVTVQIKAESVNDLTVTDAWAAIQRIEFGLYTAAVRAALPGPLVTVSDTREHSYRVDGRVLHAWSVDAIIRSEFWLADPTSVGIIESVIVTQTIDDGPPQEIEIP